MRSHVRFLAGFLVAVLASSPVVAQGGFRSNCTATQLGWDNYLSMLVADCADSGGQRRSSFISVDDCITNSEGTLKPQKR